MQAEAIFSAISEAKHRGISIQCEIMIPLIGHEREFELLKARVESIAMTYSFEPGSYKIGTMIELPRACLTAGPIAKRADFFSFGTNDLTQMTLGVSRDDSGSFLPSYAALGIYPKDPFVSLDVEGVGALMERAVLDGRKQNPSLKIGVCGEHGGDPSSVSFQKLNLDYVSCSPYRIPIARLAAAQAALTLSK